MADGSGNPCYERNFRHDFDQSEPNEAAVADTTKSIPAQADPDYDVEADEDKQEEEDDEMDEEVVSPADFNNNHLDGGGDNGAVMCT